MSASRFLAWDNHAYVTAVPGTDAVEQLDRHRRAGFTVAMVNLGDADRSLEHVVRMAAFLRRWVLGHPDRFVMLRDLSDVEDARATGRLAVGFDVEGVHAVGDQPDVISLLYDLGVRWMLFVYNRRNRAGSGVHDDTDEGLTAFGRRLAAEMDRVGMVKCLSHTGHRTALEVMAASEKPCVFTHSNAAAVAAHARNIPDELVRACADTGGVVGINGINVFLSATPGAPPTAELFVRHVDHMVQLVGADHVGIGLDYGYVGELSVTELLGGAGGSDFWPPGHGYDDRLACLAPEALPEIVERLEGLGYSNADIAKILGGNWVRIAEAVWR